MGVDNQTAATYSPNGRVILVRKGRCDNNSDEIIKMAPNNSFSNSVERKLFTGGCVSDIRKSFEKIEIKKDIIGEWNEEKKLDAKLEKYPNPFSRVSGEKFKKDESEKEDPSRKRKVRLEEFINSNEAKTPLMKRQRTGSVYDTIKKFALSDDKEEVEVKRKAMTSSESYQLLLKWINNRINNYSAFAPQISDLSVSTFSNGLILAALAHSFNPFQTTFFSVEKKSRDERLLWAWKIFGEVTGEEPVYSLDDVFNSKSRNFDHKCLMTMLFHIREKVILQNLSQHKKQIYNSFH